MESTEFNLDATSAALIFNQDMSTELVLPKIEDTETVDFEENQNLFIAMAIASLLDDQGFRNYVAAKLETMFETMDDIKSSAEGGCSGCACTEDSKPCCEDPGDGSGTASDEDIPKPGSII